MKYPILTLFSLLMLAFSRLPAQQLPFWSSFYEHGFVWNPALTAKWNMMEVSLAHRREWTGFENAPEFASLGFQYPFIRRFTRVSIGGYLDYDKVGPFQNYGFTGTYTYRFEPQLFDNRDDVISLGMAVRVQQFNFRPERLTPFDGFEGDLTLLEQRYSSLLPNVGVGAFYISVSDFYSFKSHYYAGISVNQLIPFTLAEFPLGSVQAAPHATLHIGYRHFPFRKGYYFEPNIFVAYTPTRPVAVMANLRFEVVQAMWVSAGGSTDGEVFLQGGVILDDRSFLRGIVNDGTMRVGGKLNYHLGAIRQYAGVGYELYLAYLYQLER